MITAIELIKKLSFKELDRLIESEYHYDPDDSEARDGDLYRALLQERNQRYQIVPERKGS